MESNYGKIYVKKIYYFNLYVIKGIDGDILIDTGFICMKRKIKKWLDKFNIKLILLTHAHVDHIWNVSYIKKLYDCEVAISNLDIKNIDNSIIKSKPSNKYHKSFAKLMNFGMRKFVSPKFEIEYLLNDNDIIDKFGLNIRVVSLPGHTNGSIGYLYGDNIFCGDVLVNRKLHVEIAYQNQDNDLAKESVLKLLDLKPKNIYIGHDHKIKYSKLEKSISKLV